MGNGMQSLIAKGAEDLSLGMPVEMIVSSVTGMFLDLSREHTRRVVIESQCGVILAQIRSTSELERIRLKKEFKKQGLVLDSLLGILQREASSDRGCTEMFKLLLDTVITILNTNPIDHIPDRLNFSADFDREAAEEYSDSGYGQM